MSCTRAGHPTRKSITASHSVQRSSPINKLTRWRISSQRIHNIICYFHQTLLKNHLNNIRINTSALVANFYQATDNSRYWGNFSSVQLSDMYFASSAGIVFKAWRNNSSVKFALVQITNLSSGSNNFTWCFWHLVKDNTFLVNIKYWNTRRVTSILCQCRILETKEKIVSFTISA